MFVFGNVFIASAGLVHSLLRLAYALFFIRIILSWLQPNPPPGFLRDIIAGIFRITDPPLDAARRALPFLRAGAIDFSPIAVFLAIGFLDSFLTRTLYQLGGAF